MAFDEFALQSVPNTGYAWAPKNTAPTVPSDERRRRRLNGFLSVDLGTGITHADFRTESKTDDVVFVVVLTILRLLQQGYRAITLILDNARTHGLPMQTAVRELLTLIAELVPAFCPAPITVEFLHTPRYSPAFNPAEYLIHWSRQQVLYHLPSTFTLTDKAERLRRHLAQGPPFSPRQMHNLLRHIHHLSRNGQTMKWPILE